MKKTLRQLWYFIWEDNSVLSWAVNVILAFVIIKFLVYPGLGFILDTPNPVVAIVSGSMEHDERFDAWWDTKAGSYNQYDISKEDFSNFQFKNGFNKGDLMILKGKKAENLEVGAIIVFRAGGSDPIIHRIVTKNSANNTYTFSTHGDNNQNQLPYEKAISGGQIIGQTKLKIPLLGYVKIIFTELVAIITDNR